MIAVAVALSTVLAVAFRDYLVPAVVAWASFGILVKTHMTNPSVAAAALIAALVTAFISLVVVLWNLNLFSRWQSRRDQAQLRATTEFNPAPRGSSQAPSPIVPRDSFAG